MRLVVAPCHVASADWGIPCFLILSGFVLFPTEGVDWVTFHPCSGICLDEVSLLSVLFFRVDLLAVDRSIVGVFRRDFVASIALFGNKGSFG
jgi:hypothetical protein